MGERIEQPPILQGDEKAQLQQLWSYLYQVSEAMNNNLLVIGGNELTDSERQIMSGILGSAEPTEPNFNEMETLKSLIIKTADFVQTSIQEYRMNILGESVASGQFGQYVRNTALNVVVTPEGITQDYSFEEVVQGLKEFSVNAKNYIKTGLLRTVGVLPVYGVAIGKDVVTFSEDGTETYNDGNKVAELTAEELSFWQNSVKIASYTGNKISFLYNGTEVFYIQAGKIYASGDMEITSGKKLMIASGAELDIYSGGNINVKSGGKSTIESGADLDIANGGDINVKSGGKVSLESGAGLDVNNGGNLNVKSGGKTTIESGGDMDIANGGNLNVKSGGNLNVKSGGKTTIESGGGMDIANGGNLNVKSGGKTTIESGGGMDIENGGNLNVKSGGNMNVKSGGKTTIESGAGLDIANGGNMNVKNGGKTTIESGANLDIANGGDLNVKSGGEVTVENGGDLNVSSGGDINVENGGNVNVKSGGKTTIETGAGLDIANGGNLNIKSGGNVNVKSGGAVTIENGGDLYVSSGGDISVQSGGKLTIDNGGDLDIANGGDLNISNGGGIVIQSGADFNIKTGGVFTVDSGQFEIDINGNATFAGTLSANCIKGGTLTLGGFNNGNGTISILDNTNQEIGKWNNAGIDAQGKLKSTDWLFDSDGATYSKKINNVTRKMRVGYMTYGSSQPTDAGLYFSMDTNNATAELTLATNYLGAASGRVVLTGTGINKSALYQMGGVSLGKSDHAWIDYFGMNLLAPGNMLSFYARRSSSSGARWYMEYDQYNGYQYFCSDGASRSYIGQASALITYGYFDNLWWNTPLNSSSREVKHDIEELHEQGDVIDRLQPVSYVYNDDQKKRKRFGLIWEDAAEVLPEICLEEDGKKGINYIDLIPVLLKEIQDLRKRVKELEGGRETC